jgi:hypothetical protein
MKVTIYPMMHIALPSFFERLGRELERCRYILHEGVSWHTDGRRHPLYDLAARNLGLAAQEDALRYPAGAERISLDMGNADFRGRLGLIPFGYRVLLRSLRPLLWLLTLTPRQRDWFLAQVLTGPHRRHAVSEETPLDQLVVGARDQVVTRNLERFYHQHGQCEARTFVAIVFGSSHMPAICRCLGRLGFKPGSQKWLELIRVPTRNAGAT